MMTKCDLCKQLYKVHLMVPNRIWRYISLTKEGKDNLCGVCIIRKIEKLNIPITLYAKAEKEVRNCIRI